MEKELSGPVIWRDNGGTRHESRVALKIGGIGIEGLFVRLLCPKTIDMHGFLVQIEVEQDKRDVINLSRIDWKAGHTNSLKAPPHLQLIDIPSTHFHNFTLNYIETEQRMRTRNLPVAEPIEPDPASVEELLACAEKLLRIKGLSAITLPPLQRMLSL